MVKHAGAWAGRDFVLTLPPGLLRWRKEGVDAYIDLDTKMSNDCAPTRGLAPGTAQALFLFYVRLQEMHFAFTRAPKEHSPAQQLLAAAPRRQFLSFADVSIPRKVPISPPKSVEDRRVLSAGHWLFDDRAR